MKLVFQILATTDDNIARPLAFGLLTKNKASYRLLAWAFG